jgi:oligopeptide transport system substrate-binding protein
VAPLRPPKRPLEVSVIRTARPLAILALAVAFPLAGCPGAKDPVQTFTFNNGAEPETLDPQLMTGVPEHKLANGLFEGLVTQHPKTLEPVPGVAETWDVSADGLTYTFHLRKDAKWTDGTPVTARDFHASWQRALEPSTAVQYAYMLYPLKNGEEYNKQGAEEKEGGPKRPAISFDQVGVKVVDDHTLEVTLEQPCAYFLDLVAFETLMPVPTELIKKHGDRWVRPENIIGNGPFKLSEWLPNQRVVMVKNPHYWNAASVKLEKVVALPYEDLDTAYKLFLQGQCDWMNDVPIGKIEESQRRPEYYASPYYGSYFYRFNVTKKPFDDPRVRKALSLCIDRTQITRDLLRAGQVPATWFVPAWPPYEPAKGLAMDRDRARALLAEAGYPEGKGFPTTELLYNTLEAHKLVAENVVQQWRENLGITVSLRNSEWKVYLNDVQTLQYQIARAAWIGDYLDPNTFLDMFVTGGGNNQTGWSNAKYDGLIADAGKELDPKRRMQLLQQAERLLIEEELPIMPMYIYVNKGLLSKKVRGWHENIRDHHPFQYLSIDETIN